MSQRMKLVVDILVSGVHKLSIQMNESVPSMYKNVFKNL